MKLNISCEKYKSISKDKLPQRCSCHYLNRNFHRELKHWQTFMNSMGKKK